MTLLLSHPASLDHLTPPGHPERPDRIRAVEEVLGESRFDGLTRGEAPEGNLDLVALVTTSTMWKSFGISRRRAA